MLLEETINRDYEKCVDIIYRYIDLFPLSRIIRGYAASLPLVGDNLEFYHKHTIAKRLGIYDNIKKQLENTNHINYILPTDKLNIIDDITKCNIVNVLKMYADNERHAEFKEMLKKENLC